MNWKYLHLFGLLFIILVAGCAVPRTTAVLPEPRPLVEDYEPILPPSPPEAGNIESYQQQTPSGVITLQEALSLALLQNPTLAAFSYEIRAAEARALQANLYPNPEVGIELENFAGSGSFKGSGEMESTLLLGQSILLGGKRSKAVRAAALEGDLFAWDYEAVRMDVFTDVRLAFLEALAAQQRVELNEELVQLAEQLLQTIKRRVKAGKISPAELSRAQVRLSNQQVDLQLAQQELKAARLKLASTWGGKSVTFTSVSGVLDRLIKLPKLKQLQSLLSQNPDIARYEIALKQRKAVIALEDARRIPDPTLS
ncbi:MAG: TolC family protein, partial [Calditrichia bacterium]